MQLFVGFRGNALKPDLFGIYIHWPFCKSHCPYCDFNSHVRPLIHEEEWVDALLMDLDSFHPYTKDRRVTSIFFGGGTPSLLSPSSVERILSHLSTKWPVSAKVEVTLEANPTSSETQKFREFRKAGINRLSIGVQALDAEALKFLGRQHSLSQALSTLADAAEIFPRFSFDLIYARPEQTLENWEKELSQALMWAKGHLSLYQLTIEPGTPFYSAHLRGDFKMPCEEESAQFYELTHSLMAAQGYEAYEISNYAAAGHHSLHNKTYWTYQDYIGVGPGAHSRLTLEGIKYAIRRHKYPELWQTMVREKKDGAHKISPLSLQDHATESVMVGLRLKEGLSRARFSLQTGRKLEHVLGIDKLRALAQENLLEETSLAIALTDEGRKKLDAVLGYLFPLAL